MKSITQFITQKLKLKENESKSAVARPQERKFLGFSFTDGPEVKRAIAPKSLVRFKRRVRELSPTPRPYPSRFPIPTSRRSSGRGQRATAAPYADQKAWAHQGIIHLRLCGTIDL
jgi:hypothetical protein